MLLTTLILADPRIESWRAAGFTTVVAAPKGGMFPGQAAVLDLAGERPGNLVVKAPIGVPVSLQAPGGFRNYPGSLMGAVAYVRQVWLDANWSSQAEAAYEKNSTGVERPKYDRTNATLADALGKHEVVLLPGNTSHANPTEYAAGGGVEAECCDLRRTDGI